MSSLKVVGLKPTKRVDEVQAMLFWTRVRFPPGPPFLFRREELIHYPVSKKKMSPAWGHWGRKTACGMMFECADESITACERMITCATCIDYLLEKHEQAIKILVWNKESPRCFECKKLLPDWFTCDDCLRRRLANDRRA